MLNDEQILLKTAQLLENIDISEQKPEKLLRELDESEYEIVKDVLDDLSPDELAFNKLFAGKMRLIINFPTMNNATELGKFGEFFKKQDFDVDWEKGLVSAVREVHENRTEDLVNQLMGGPPVQPKIKKIQMKVGKFFAKVAELSSKRDILYQKVYDHMNKMNYTGAYGEIDAPWKVSGKMIKAALDEKEQEDYNRINTQIGLYIPAPGVAGPAGYALTDLVTKMAKYWQTNAGYIKKEINKLDDDTYSIILTRSPIDVMRMSDFDEITSCHSPPSRGSTQGNYYKCAVAEAHGHGAVAYVVKTEEILEATGAKDLQEAEDDLQTGEVFYDGERAYDSGVLEPVSRGRLRQVRYYDTDSPKRYDEGTEVAMPEKRVYGANIPGFMDRVIAWARENQQEVIESMPKEDGKVDLSRFMIFGGSYEDTPNPAGRRALMSKLLGISHFDDFVGSMKQNADTENTLDHNALSGLAGRWEQEVEAAQDEWNQRYAIVNVDADVEDDGDGGLYISARAIARISISKDDFVKTPNSYPTAMHAFDYITDIYGDIFKVDEAWIVHQDDKLLFCCDLNLEHPEIGESALMYDPDSFNEFCSVLDVNIDDKHDAFTAYITEFLKREGWLQGAAYVNLVDDIDNNELSSYEWDVRTDGEHSTESYESTASVSHDFDPEELGVNPQVLADILNSTGWRVMIRQELLKPAKDELGISYNVDLNGTSADISGSEHVGYLVQYNMEFVVNQDAPDAVIELFRELVTGDMDDEDRLRNIFDWAMKQALNARLPASQQQNLDERLVKTWKGFLGR
jgi:hypothetical protein